MFWSFFAQPVYPVPCHGSGCLVQQVGLCNDCHTPRDDEGPPVEVLKGFLFLHDSVLKTRMKVSAKLFDHAEGESLGDQNGCDGFPGFRHSVDSYG